MIRMIMVAVGQSEVLSSSRSWSRLEALYSVVSVLSPWLNFSRNLLFLACTFARISSFLACPCSREQAFYASSSRISMMLRSQVEKPMPCSWRRQVMRAWEGPSPTASSPSQASMISADSMSFSRSISARAQRAGSSSAVQTSTRTALLKRRGSTNFSSMTFSSKSVNFWVPVKCVSSQATWQKQFLGKPSGTSGSIRCSVSSIVSFRLSSSIFAIIALLRSSKFSCSSPSSSFRRLSASLLRCSLRFASSSKAAIRLLTFPQPSMGIQSAMSADREVDQQLEALIAKAHRALAANFTFESQTRELDSRENSLLARLDPGSPRYRQLAGALAIDSYLSHLIALLARCEPLLEITTVLFGDLRQARGLCRSLGAGEIEEEVGQAWANLGKLAEVTHELFPRSPLVAVHRSFMEGEAVEPAETIYGRLYDENMELREQLAQNDRQVLELEIKLTKLLQEHDGCEGSVESSARLLELREGLAAREEEIGRMNEEFSYEIEKYNTVYEAMKREIEELREYKEVDLLEMVQRLQTEIVKLREEKERDEAVIRELRERQAGVGSPYSRKGGYSRLHY